MKRRGLGAELVGGRCPAGRASAGARSAV